MFNLHLLQIELSVEEYQQLAELRFSFRPEPFLNRLPAYVIARCPICSIENVEGLNTYSLHDWDMTSGESVFDYRLIVHHCEHFALAQAFINFHGVWPAEAEGMLGSEVPHVIGHLLEKRRCLAVIHALPICRIEDDAFVPRYTLFIISYFSKSPKKAYDAVITFNVDYVEPGVAWPFIPPPDGCEHWWNLRHWVSAGKLFWVDGDGPALGIQTHDTDAFPYGGITGRTQPYEHTFPYPLPKPSRVRKAKS
jgi:hypothetical protein